MSKIATSSVVASDRAGEAAIEAKRRAVRKEAREDLKRFETESQLRTVTVFATATTNREQACRKFFKDVSSSHEKLLHSTKDGYYQIPHLRKVGTDKAEITFYVNAGRLVNEDSLSRLAGARGFNEVKVTVTEETEEEGAARKSRESGDLSNCGLFLDIDNGGAADSQASELIAGD